MIAWLCGSRSTQKIIHLVQKTCLAKRYLNLSANMANSRFDYVRNFEKNDAIIPNCWIVVRIDGKAFHKFTQKHDFDKPNDDNGLNLMSYAAAKVMKEVLDGGRTNTQAQEDLSGTFSADKHEILFSQFGINYNNLPQMYRKGTILLRKNVEVPNFNGKSTQIIVPFFTDLIRDPFWKENEEILTRDKIADYRLDEEQLNHPLVTKQFEIARRRKNNMNVTNNSG